MSQDRYKKYTATWKQFLNEGKSSNISEAPFGAPDKKMGSTVSQAFGGKKGITAYPINSRENAAKLMLQGTTIPTTTQDKKAVTAVTDFENKIGSHTTNVGGLASLNLKSRMYMIADGERCEIATANWQEHGETALWVTAPVWNLDTGDILPGHDGRTDFFFDDQKNYETFLSLLKEAISDTKGDKGIIGECPVRMVHQAHEDLLHQHEKVQKERFDDTILVPLDSIFPTKSKIIVGTMNIIWNNDYLPAVVVSFGDFGTGKKGPYAELPYFLTPDGAKQFLNIMKSSGSKAGSIYQPVLGSDRAYPSVPSVYKTVCKKPKKPMRAAVFDTVEAGVETGKTKDPFGGL
jgi:hypothetical protein